ncbi:MAG: NTP transferase domain-containing protein [Chitinophagaceae bacterium]|nr:NTP transferase domain-containing protein [Chitinophagaceae bacterium]
MKAIIPVAGAGTKLRPLTYTQPKALIPIAGKAILSYIVDQLKDAGINEFIFIVGYFGDKIQDYIKHNYPEIKSQFVYKKERQGTGHAIELTRSIVNHDEVFVALGDTICEYDLHEVMQSPYSMLGVRKVDDPRDFGVATINEEGFIESVVEKPAIPKSNTALVGLYKIKESSLLYSCLQHLFVQDIKTQGEYNLTDALDCMIQRGAKFKCFKVKNWFDCGKKETLIESNATLLKKSGGNISNSHSFNDTIIIPPVSIAQGCQINNSIIGPHVAIGSNSSISNSVVRNSIIGSYTHINQVVLDSSLIGSDANVNGLSKTLNIGDNTEIEFG